MTQAGVQNDTAHDMIPYTCARVNKSNIYYAITSLNIDFTCTHTIIYNATMSGRRQNLNRLTRLANISLCCMCFRDFNLCFISLFRPICVLFVCITYNAGRS